MDAECSPAVQQKIVAAASDCRSYAEASRMLKDLAELEVSAKQCQRVTQRIGEERVAQREARVKAYEQLPLPQQQQPAPAAPVGDWKQRVATVLVDGGRAQVRDERWGQPQPPGSRRSWWREPKAAALITFQSQASEQDPLPEIPACLLDSLWIVPLLQDLKHSRAGDSPPASPSDSSAASAGAASPPAAAAQDDRKRWSPEPLVRSVVATLGDYEHLGRLARVEAYQRNFHQAPRKAFLGDGHLANWGLHAREFPDYVAIVDLLHALSYVYRAARECTPDLSACWQRYHRWATLVWQGRVSEWLPELTAEVARGGASQGPLQECLTYLEHNASRMRYADYRRQGLPITTARMESTIKQLNRRMKGSEKFWDAGGERQLQLCADRLSDTNPLEAFWSRQPNTRTGFRKPQAKRH